MDEAADEIDRLRAALATAQAERDEAQTRLRGLAESLQAAGHDDLASVFRVTRVLDEARRVLRFVEPHLRFACERYAENAYSRDEIIACDIAHDIKDALAAVLAQEET